MDGMIRYAVVALAYGAASALLLEHGLVLQSYIALGFSGLYVILTLT